MSKSTTLITFMLQTPTDVFSVELFGSWDNFDKAYQLSRDKRVGRGQWRGCHRFENIICDGDLTDRALKRDGALKMGGTYWYFYRLNGDVEYYDPYAPCTSICPSLPGQSVNVLDVPVQAEGRVALTRKNPAASSDSHVFTLDPGDKYSPVGIKRAATISAVSRHAQSCEGLVDGHIGTQGHEHDSMMRKGTASSIYESPSLEPQQAPPTAFQRLRRTMSAVPSSRDGPPSRSVSSWSRKLFSRARSSRKAEDEPPVPEVPMITEDMLRKMRELVLPGDEGIASTTHGGTGAYESTPQPMNEPTAAVDTTISRLASLESLRDAFQSSYSERIGSDQRPTSSRGSGHSKGFQIVHAAIDCQSDDLNLTHGPESHLRYHDSAAFATNIARGPSNHNPANQLDHEQSRNAPERTSQKFQTQNAETSYPESVAFSFTQSESGSPGLMSNTTGSRRISSIVHSQPETPRMLDFDGDAFLWQRDSDPDLDGKVANGAEGLPGHRQFPALQIAGEDQPNSLQGFQGYSLPHNDQASTVTIKKPRSHDLRPPLPQDWSAQRVQSWDDGAQHRIGGHSDMIDDLGYLGTLIN